MLAYGPTAIRSLARLGLILALLTAMLGVVPVPAAHADTITVTDTSGGTGGPGCTLRDAITAANTNTPTGGCPGGDGADTIELPNSATITLNTVDNITRGPAGLPMVTTEITINANNSTIERDTTAGTPAFRLFTVFTGGILTINDATIQNGLTDATLGGIVGSGGCLTVENSTLTLVSSTVTNCEVATGGTVAEDGGGIYIVTGPATVTLIFSTVSNNRAEDDGGGIQLYDVGVETITLNIYDSVIHNNQSGTGGGTTADGGGIFTYPEYGMVNVTRSVIRDNTATDDGGGIFTTSSAVSIVDSTLSGNRAEGAGLENEGGGIYDNSNIGSLTISGSTLSGNTATDNGGGIHTDDNAGATTITNSTLSGNTATVGGGIHTDDAGDAVNLNWVTLSGNTGGGIDASLGGTVNVQNSIVADQVSGNDCTGTMTSNGYNLESGTSCGFTGTGDQQNANANLAGLADNGGPTWTHALNAGSDAIEKIPNGSNGCTAGTSVDQRKAPRAGGGGSGGASCEIGAYEYESTVPTAVALAAFDATVDGGAIYLDWETVTELDNLGFNVYRADSPGGERSRLNANLIPAQAPGSAVGAVYRFVDEGVQAGLTYYYWLEDVDVYGATALHGPVSAELNPLRRLLPARPRPAPVGPGLRSR